MTGEELYQLYFDEHAARNCGVDSFEDIDEDDREVWNNMAEQIAPMQLVADLEAVVEDFMPNVANCVLQDYGRLNDALVACSQLPGLKKLKAR